MFINRDVYETKIFTPARDEQRLKKSTRQSLEVTKETRIYRKEQQ